MGGRWASLALFTPRRENGLPGLEFPGDPDGYPGRDEVVSYLGLYARTFELPVELDSRVWSMTKEEERFVLELDERTIEADAVVVATGPFQTPRVPASPPISRPTCFRSTAPTTTCQGDSVRDGARRRWRQHRVPDRLRAVATHEVHLSVGSRQSSLPQRFLGHDLFWWLRKTGCSPRTSTPGSGGV